MIKGSQAMTAHQVKQDKKVQWVQTVAQVELALWVHKVPKVQEVSSVHQA